MRQHSQSHGPFSVILADPPWQFKVWSDKGSGRTADQHYPVMTAEELLRLPVGDLAARDCALFLWVTNPTLPQGFETLRAWGFDYKTVAFVWTKPQIGCGYWTRAQSELVLLGTRGQPKKASSAVRQHVAANRTRHSAKPPEVRDRIVQLLGDVPRIELFAREEPEGWVALGNEVGERLDIRESIPKLLREWPKESR